MRSFTILHLTDVHFGQFGMDGRWPNVRENLFLDLNYLLDSQIDVIDLLAFTGDIANRGLPADYALATGFLNELWNFLLDRTHDVPAIAAVPGNHDLQRPSELDAHGRALIETWDDNVESALIGGSTNEYVNFVRQSFAAYSDWIDQQPFEFVGERTTGRLPGEFSGVVSRNELRVGVIGLNTAFRHLSDGVSEGSLSLTPRQIQAAVGGDLPKWSRATDVGVVLTHHPLSWIQNRTEAVDALFSESSRIRLHLCGHLHDEAYGQQALGTPDTYVTHQGTSLFGLDRFRGSEDRRHGYALLTINVDDAGAQSITVWPREASRTSSGFWKLDRSTKFGLDRGSDCSRSVPIGEGLAVSEEGLRPSVPDSVTKDVDANLERLFRHLAGGQMVGVLGDLVDPSTSTNESTYLDFRFAAWTSAGLDRASHDLQTPDETLFELVAQAQTRRDARALFKKLLTSPSERVATDVQQMLNAPWASLLSLSPCDVVRSTARLAPNAEVYEYVDTGRDPYFQRRGRERLMLDAAVTPWVIEGKSNALENSQSRQSAADWEHFTKTMLSRTPVTFLCDDPTTLQLWSWVSARALRPKDYRPDCFIVSPFLPPAMQAQLELLDVRWIPMRVSEFVHDAMGATDLGRRRARNRPDGGLGTRSGDVVLGVGELVRTAAGGSRQFLRGSTPTWGDVVGNFAVPTLSPIDQVFNEVATTTARILLVTGTAGCGRTTTLMQVACRLQVENKVGWIDRNINVEPSRILDQIRREAYDIVLIDDVDVFGSGIEALLRDIQSGDRAPRLVIASARSIRASLVPPMMGLVTLPLKNLGIQDVHSLCDKIQEFNLVSDRRTTRSDLYQLLATGLNPESGDTGQLLVGMIQATSGMEFFRKVESECDQLNAGQMSIYAVLALVTAIDESMTLEQVLQVSGGTPEGALDAVNQLERARLVRTNRDGRMTLRHRVVAEAVQSLLRQRGLLAIAAGSALRVFCASGVRETTYSNPERRTMIRLLSHSYLLGLKLTDVEIRGIYQSVEDIMCDDFHFYLQWGSFEVEAGLMDNARHALMAAMTTGLGHQDPLVLTEFSLLRLRLANDDPAGGLQEEASRAISDLHRVIRSRGAASPHAYVVLAREGVTWLSGNASAQFRDRTLVAESLELLERAGNLDRRNPQVAEVRLPAIETLHRTLLR